MKIIYWRWKDQKTINKSYVQKDLGNILELSEDRWTSYPNVVLKKDIVIIIPDYAEDEITIKKDLYSKTAKGILKKIKRLVDEKEGKR